MSDEKPWRSLAEREGTAATSTSDEPPFGAIPELLINRRDFLKLTGGALGLGALAACSGPPAEQIVPYVKAPPEYTLGRPNFYATALPRYGYARGVLVECHEGRPTKIEGNLRHSSSLGATDAQTQAAIRSLWDANRSRTPLHDGEPATWNQFLGELTERALRHKQDRGAGLCIVMEPTTSPSLLAQLAALQRDYPAARLYHYRPFGDRNAREGAQIAFGEPVEIYARLDKADVIVSLDSDFLGDHPDAVRLAAEFAQRREPERNGGAMNRLYVIECAPSVTGAMADHRIVRRSSEIHALAAQLASALGVGGSGEGINDAELKPLLDDLRAARGRSIILVGNRQPAAVHAIGHVLNAHLGNVGTTVDYLDPIRPPTDALKTLASDMAAGRVQTLLLLGVNPAYDMPVDADFEALLRRIPFTVHLGLYEDESALACHWHLPQAHPLESWGDLRATDGTVTICQPMIAPLFDGHTARELIAIFQGEPKSDPYSLVRRYWETQWGGAEPFDRKAPPRSANMEHIQVSDDRFTQQWQTSLQQGVVSNSAAPFKRIRLRPFNAAAQKSAATGVEINFQPDPVIGDGIDANNPWLQELAKPMTKLTWDNALLISPAMAARMQIENGRITELRSRNRTLVAPVWITPGHADEAVTLHTGYGRRAGSPVALGHGINANLLRFGDAPDFDGGVSITPTKGLYGFAEGQGHQEMENREILRSATLNDYRANPRFAQRDNAAEQGEGLFPPFPYTGYAWAMSVNLNACTGCSACVIACQAENNIATVGKEEVRRGRKMHWLRIDRYYVGSPDAPRIHFQPVPCMQCENAPCEPVCPVEASVHDNEGINVQVYNRCIGTRFCSNNCPYKVRRFNFFHYATDEPVSNHQRNPEVTVRMRGVMEKCNYCLQRITHGRINAEIEGRPLRDGEVLTACQAACPTRAIVFGDMNDPKSAVSELKRSPRDYSLLADLHTKPRTTYLAKLINPPS